MSVIALHPLTEVPAEDIEALLDAAFGIDRHQRTAYTVRSGTDPIANLSFVALRGDTLAGSLQSWPIVLSRHERSALPLTMVGPVAVLPEFQRQGVGKLMTRVVAQRLDIAHASAMMIGDPEYYEQFGFRSGPAAGWSLPGPVEPDRILLRPVPGTDWPSKGQLGPDLLRSGQRSPN